MALKVVGAGFGRTGTASLKQALEFLGFGPCYHMFEIRRQPWRGEWWWRKHKGLAADWADVFDGYNSCVDWPACAYYAEIYRANPGSKVILSVRDPEQWYESAFGTIYTMARSYPAWLKLLYKPYKTLREMADGIVWDGTFQGRFTDKAFAMTVFQDHVEKVQAEIPADDLLIFRIEEGWQPLCDFLGVTVPDEPFPCINEGSKIKAEIKIVQRRFRRVHLAILVVLSVLLLGFII